MMYSIFVVSRIQVYLEGISALFVASGRFDIAGAATSIASANTRANAVLVDFSTISPSTLSRYHQTSAHGGRIIVFGVPDDTGIAVVLLEAGAAAYVTESSTADELYDTVLQVIEQRAGIAPQIVPAVLDRLRERSAGDPARTPDCLTPRELRVAELMGEHMSNKEIASALGISVHTVKIHVHHVIQKLALGRRSEVRDVLGGRALWNTGRGWAHA